jgi:hypothetical protein
MTDADLYLIWGIGVAVFGVVILIAAGLLLWIRGAAATILAEAATAIGVAEQIEKHTSCLWDLRFVNVHLARVADNLAGLRRAAGGAGRP